MPLRLSPTATIVPAHSPPEGPRSFRIAKAFRTSRKFKPAARTRISTSPGPGRWRFNRPQFEAVQNSRVCDDQLQQGISHGADRALFLFFIVRMIVRVCRRNAAGCETQLSLLRPPREISSNKRLGPIFQGIRFWSALDRIEIDAYAAQLRMFESITFAHAPKRRLRYAPVAPARTHGLCAAGHQAKIRCLWSPP